MSLCPLIPHAKGASACWAELKLNSTNAVGHFAQRWLISAERLNVSVWNHLGAGALLASIEVV